MGVPIGILIDRHGPRPFTLVGALFLVAGYNPLRRAFDEAVGSIPLLCLFSFLSGLGGCLVFAAAIKTSALNWPHHGGTATAFPLAAFGLSAFFFSALGFGPLAGDTRAFLFLLTFGAPTLVIAAFFFLKVYPYPTRHGCKSTVRLPTSYHSNSQALRCSPINPPSVTSTSVGSGRALRAIAGLFSPWCRRVFGDLRLSTFELASIKGIAKASSRSC